VERPVYLGDLSATLLNIGLLNITQDDACLRGASYNLICAVSSALDYKDPQIIPVHGQRLIYSILAQFPNRPTGPFVPANPLALATQISERLAEHAPKVTLDFLTEFFVGYDKSDPPQKAACLHYLRPWIRNLSSFQNPTVAHYEPSGPKLRNAIRAMIEITINDKMVRIRLADEVIDPSLKPPFAALSFHPAVRVEGNGEARYQSHEHDAG
jgi:hypothetical protein